MAANWLSNKGVSPLAQTIKDNHLTGSVVTIIVVLCILLFGPGKPDRSIAGIIRKCPSVIIDSSAQVATAWSVVPRFKQRFSIYNDCDSENVGRESLHSAIFCVIISRIQKLYNLFSAA